MNKTLRIFQKFIDEKELETEVFTEKVSLREFPPGFKPTSIITVKDGQKILFVFACNREQFYIDIVDDSTDTKAIVKELEKQLKQAGITQVR